MSTIAELKLIVDASQLEQAKRALDEFNNAASKVDTGSISKAIGEYSKEADALVAKTQEVKSKTEELTNTLKEGANSVVTMGDSFNKAASSVAPLAANMDKLKESQKESLAIEKEVIRSQQQADAQRLKLISGLQEELALFGKSKHEIALYRAEQLGVLDTVAPLVRELEALAEAKRKEAEASKSSGSKSKADKQQEIDMAKEEVRLLNESADAARNKANVQNQLAEAERRQSEARNKSLKRDIESQELKNITQASKELKEERQKEALATKQVAEEFQKLRVQIDPVKGAYEKLYAQLAKLEELKKKSKGNANLIDPNEVKELEETINRNITQLDKLGATTGKTAKEMAFAMRGLPAQFTDVVVSLQGGQKPLTVLLQQGGQIKDMFGGIVPAFKAMGSYVVGLVNPFTLLTAAVVGLGAAWYAGNKEAEEFRRIILVTSAGAKGSAQDFSNMSREISNSNVTVGRAAEVLSQVAQANNIHKDSLVEVTKATIDWSDLTGTAVEDIISDFNRLGKDPVNAIVELQEKYRFLTPEILEAANAQIEMGNSTEATRILTTELASTMQDKQAVMLAALGPVDSLLLSMKNNAKGFLDYFKNIGRSEVTADTVDIINGKIAKQTALVERLRKEYEGSMNSDFADIQRIRYEEANAELNSLNATREKAVALLEKEKNAPMTTAISEQNKSITKYKSEVEKATIALEEHKNKTKEQLEEFKKAGIVDTKAFEANAAIIEKKLLRNKLDAENATMASKTLDSAKDALSISEEQFGISGKITSERKKYIEQELYFKKLEELSAKGLLDSEERATLAVKDTVLAAYERRAILSEEHKARIDADRQSKSSSVVRESAAGRMLSSMKQQEASLIAQKEATVQLTTEERKKVELVERFRLIEEKSLTDKLTKEEQSLISNKEALLVQQDLVIAAEKQLKAKNDMLKVDMLNEGLQARLDAERKGFVDYQKSVGKSDKEKARIKEDLKLEEEKAKALDDAAKAQLANNALTDEAYKNQIKGIEEHYEERKAILDSYYEYEKEKADNWQAGFQEGLANFVDNQATMFDTVRETTEGILTTFQDGVAENITQTLMYGDSLKDSFYSLATTITQTVLKSLINIGVQQAMNAAKEMLFTKTVENVKRAEIVQTGAVSDAVAMKSAATQATAGATVASGWSLAAMMTSIGSFGKAAAIGVAGVLAAKALSKGFKSGGYTGNMGTSEVAGVVHGKEFVFDAESTSRIGVSNLENIRKGGSYGDTKTSSGGTNIVANINVTAGDGVSEESARQQGVAIAEGFEGKVLSIIARQKQAGGILSTV